MRRIKIALALSLLSTIAGSAQIKSKLPQTADPFSLKQGSSFSASGGSGGSRYSESRAVASRIAGDIASAEELIRQNYVGAARLEPGKLTSNALEGALRTLDPHSTYFDAREWRDMLDEERSGYSGIGATIANYERNGRTDTYVLATSPGSPAAKAGLRYGDRIVAIGGEPMAGRDSDDVRDKIRGGLGSTLSMTVERSRTLRTETLTITRAIVPQPSIPDAYILRPGVGYIELSGGFNYTTYDELDFSIKGLKKAGMQSLILDLRGNGGGIVDQAVKVAERFLPKATLILTQKGRYHSDDRVWTSANTAAETMPLVVLVDRDTASASEILTGALQDDDRALIVGTRTFGKGLVQEQFNLSDNSALRLTVARYYTPVGRSIQRSYSHGGKAYYDEVYNRLQKGEMTSADSIRNDTSKIFRTKAGKKIYGGGGITPDLFVGADTSSMSLALATILSKGLVGDYGYRYYLENPSLNDQFKTPQQFVQRFTINEDGWKLFNSMAARDTVNTVNLTPKDRAYLLNSLKSSVARQLFRMEGFFEAINADDTTIRKAVELLKKK